MKVSRKKLSRYSVPLTNGLLYFFHSIGILKEMDHVMLNTILFPFVWWAEMQGIIDGKKLYDAKKAAWKWIDKPFLIACFNAVAIIVILVSGFKIAPEIIAASAGALMSIIALFTRNEKT